MKILHVISGDGGGISTYVKTLIKENNTNFEFHVISFTKYGSEFVDLKNNGRVTLQVMPRFKASKILSFIMFLNTYFKNNRFDFIECHIPGLYSLPFKFFSMLYGSRKFSIHSHQTQLVYGRNKSIREQIANKINPIINRGVSNLYLACSREALVYAFGKKKSKNSRIIYNSIITKSFFPYYTDKKKNSNKIKIAHIGRHTAAKNLLFIIDLAIYLKNNQDEYVYEINMIGTGELTSKLVAAINKYDLEDILILHGRKDNIGKILKNTSLVILPSISEGLPTVIIESQATGTPSICSNNITKEVDLNLNMVEYLPISYQSNNLALWKKTIDTTFNKKTPSLESIIYSIKEKEFDSSSMFKKYREIVSEAVNE